MNLTVHCRQLIVDLFMNSLRVLLSGVFVAVLAKYLLYNFINVNIIIDNPNYKPLLNYLFDREEGVTK